MKVVISCPWLLRFAAPSFMLFAGWMFYLFTVNEFKSYKDSESKKSIITQTKMALGERWRVMSVECEDLSKMSSDKLMMESQSVRMLLIQLHDESRPLGVNMSNFVSFFNEANSARPLTANDWKRLSAECSNIANSLPK